MGFLEMAPGFAALAALCVGLRKKGVPAAFAPLTALCLAGLWTLAFGMAGVLAAGQWLLYALCAALAVWLVVGALRDKTGVDRLRAPAGGETAPGWVLFWVMSLCAAVYFAVRQPVFSGFDEYSFWGTAAKLTKTQSVLYPQAKMGWPWVSTQSPAMIVLGYFLQFFGEFAAWKVFLAYDMLLFAVYAAVLGVVKARRYEVVLPLAALCLAAPYLATVYQQERKLNTIYMSAYGDVPAGAMLGGCLALYYGLKRSKSSLWPVLPALAFAALIKENTFPIVLVAAGVMLADRLLAGKEAGSLLRRAAQGAACMAAPLAGYAAWKAYIAPVVRQSAEGGGMGDTSVSLVYAVVQSVKMLLGLEAPSERFAQAMAGVTGSFAGSPVTAFGPGAVLVGLTLLLFAAAAWLATDRAARKSAVCAGVLTALGFAAYNFELVVSYAFVFRAEQAAELVDYNRYLTTYYLGWLLCALAVLGQSLAKPAKKRLRLAALGRCALCALAAVSFLRIGMLLPARYSVVGYQDMDFCDEKQSERLAARVLAETGPEARVYFVSQGDNGLRWFRYSYQLLPAVLDYSNGGGTFGLPLKADEDEPAYYIPRTAAEFAAEVRKSGSEYLFIERLDDDFTRAYSELFSDGLARPNASVSGLYRVDAGGAESAPFRLVEMGE